MRFLRSLIAALWLISWGGAACAISTSLGSSIVLTGHTELELTTLETSITVTSTSQMFFTLVDLQVQNNWTQVGQVYVRLHHTLDTVPDVTGTFSLNPNKVNRIQLPTTLSGVDLGLGAHTFEVYITRTFARNDLIVLPASYLGIFDPMVPSGIIVSLNGETGAVQTFATDTDCEVLTITSGTDVHTFCLPLTSAGTDALAFGQSSVAADVASIAIGKSAQSSQEDAIAIGVGSQCDQDRAVCIGSSSGSSGEDSIAIGYTAVANANSVCIGQNCAQAVGATAQVQLGSPDTIFTELLMGQGDGAAASPTSITFRPNYGNATDTSGGSLTLSGGQGTGAAGGGNLIFAYNPAGSTGTTPTTVTSAFAVVGSTGDLVSTCATCEIGDPLNVVPRVVTTDLLMYDDIAFAATGTSDIGTLALPVNEVFADEVTLSDNDCVNFGASKDWTACSDGTDLTITRAVGSGILDLAGPVSVGNRFILAPTAEQALAAGTAIVVSDTGIAQISATGATTLTGTPTIATGTDGQVVTVINVDDTDAITLQDETSLAGSNLRLAGATDAVLGPRDSVTLLYTTALADWVQIGASNN